MTIIKASHARRRFSEILDRVAKGEEITITKFGAPVVMLVQVASNNYRLTHQEIVEGMRSLRRRVKPFKGGIQEILTAARSPRTRI